MVLSVKLSILLILIQIVVKKYFMLIGGVIVEARRLKIRKMKEYDFKALLKSE